MILLIHVYLSCHFVFAILRAADFASTGSVPLIFTLYFMFSLYFANIFTSGILAMTCIASVNVIRYVRESFFGIFPLFSSHIDSSYMPKSRSSRVDFHPTQILTNYGCSKNIYLHTVGKANAIQNV